MATYLFTKANHLQTGATSIHYISSNINLCIILFLVTLTSSGAVVTPGDNPVYSCAYLVRLLQVLSG